MENFKATLFIPPSLVGIADGVRRNLATKVLPKAMDAAAAVVLPVLTAELPDGDRPNGNQPPSRSRQLAKAKRDWPTKMKRETAIKRFRPRENTILRLIGVRTVAKHAKFNHGKKAMSHPGRRHIFWGKRRESSPVYRRQKHDIARIVSVKVEPAVTAVIKQHLEHAIAHGELL